jgi:hypothetical protein
MVRTYYFLRLVEMGYKTVRFFVPPMVRAFGFVISIMLTGVLTFWGGVPKRCSLLADDWLDDAVAKGFPTQWAPYLYYVLWGLAFTTIVVSWVGLAYLSVWLVNHIL